eukprot:TRINITY_DN38147_c1_g1_i5.p1 TRINITY_DN38147_c1_g1~~TRINITY_DN38147_c1_g1_i5.p1  ORF type:complete len:281 (-),score=18.13 TRINITY_DN38147_c1_g1_i5:584-1426(-)
MQNRTTQKGPIGALLVSQSRRPLLDEHSSCVEEERAAAAALLKLRHVRTVVAASYELEEDLGRRNASLRWVAGDPSLAIKYKECGLTFHLDLSRRLSRLSRSQGGLEERQRIASQVRPGERILVLGSGFGLTACILGRHTKCAEVVGIDRNAVAHEFAELNVNANHLAAKVFCVHGDPYDPTALGKFHRVCAFLPFHQHGKLVSLAELDKIASVIEPGGVLHCYTFESEDQFSSGGAEQALEQMSEACPERSVELLWRGKVPSKTIGPDGFRVGNDFLLS